MPNGGIFKQIFDDLFALIFELIELKRALGPHPPFPLFAPVEEKSSGFWHPVSALVPCARFLRSPVR